MNLSYQKFILTWIGGALPQNLFGDIQLSRIHIHMHWWDINTKSFRRLAAIKNTYWHALVGTEHRIFSAIFSYQENLLTCIGRTLTQNLFGDFQLPRILFDMHWWDLNAKSFPWTSVIKSAYWNALVGLYHKIFLAIISYQEHLFTFIDRDLKQNLLGDF